MPYRIWGPSGPRLQYLTAFGALKGPDCNTLPHLGPAAFLASKWVQISGPICWLGISQQMGPDIWAHLLAMPDPCIGPLNGVRYCNLGLEGPQMLEDLAIWAREGPKCYKVLQFGPLRAPNAVRYCNLAPSGLQML